MSEFDSIESELSALRPRELSAELKQRIADDLARPSPPVQLKRPASTVISAGAFVGSLVATGLLALVLWRSGDRNIQTNVPAVPIQPVFAAAFDGSLPSYWSYRNALNESESLDAVLDKYSFHIPDLNPTRARIPVFARFDSKSDALNGEL